MKMPHHRVFTPVKFIELPSGFPVHQNPARSGCKNITTGYRLKSQKTETGNLCLEALHKGNMRANWLESRWRLKLDGIHDMVSRVASDYAAARFQWNLKWFERIYCLLDTGMQRLPVGNWSQWSDARCFVPDLVSWIYIWHIDSL